MQRKRNGLVAPLAWTATLACLAAIAWTFTHPPPKVIEDLDWADPVFHLIGFFVATLLGLVAVSYTRSLRHLVMLVPLATIAVGVGVEVAQQWWSPVHEASLEDVIVNAAGALAALLVWAVVRRALGYGRPKHP